jgi:CubicO group peptidase (beta-lactamase class C family)
MKRSTDAIERALELAISDGGEVGLQVAAYVGGEMGVVPWAGIVDPGTQDLVSGETLFNVFSTTKVATEVALHIQAERGYVDYYSPIATYWPEFGRNGKEKGTVYDVLTHRLGLPLMPATVTPERMCDWEWMTSQIAMMHPLFEPGTHTVHMPYTFGWIAGEIVRRTDPSHRAFGVFVQQEICEPLHIDSLWLGIPAEAEPRVARILDLPANALANIPPDAILNAAIPLSVQPRQDVFGRSDVRRSCHPGAGGIMNARSLARLFAMLACGGELDGVRLLSEDRVRSFTVQRPPVDFDPIYSGQRGSIGGFWLPDGKMPVMAPAGQGRGIFAQPGAGGSIGWADLDARLAVGITHNRMFVVPSPEANPLARIGHAVRESVRQVARY